MTAVQRAIFAKRHSLSNGWAEDSYGTLAARDTPITPEEEVQLGCDVSLRMDTPMRGSLLMSGHEVAICNQIET